MSKQPAMFYFKDQLWHNNQILVAILGICSALGVTNRLSVALTMGVSVTFVTAFSSYFVSLLRKVTPDSVRMITQLAIISTFVTIIDQFLKAYMFDFAKVMTVYVGLIITNCLVMGRAEGMAKNIAPVPAFMDGLGAGMGYMLVICAVGGIREFFGFGQLLGYQLIPEGWYATAESPDGYANFVIMISPPAAFFIIGMMIWGHNYMNQRK